MKQREFIDSRPKIMFSGLIILFFINEILANPLEILNQPENSIAMSIINSLSVKNCIFICSDFKKKEVKIIKMYSKKDIVTTIMTYEEIIENFKSNTSLNVKTMIVTNETNSHQLIETFETLEKVSEDSEIDLQ